jgi:hypothetical protein
MVRCDGLGIEGFSFRYPNLMISLLILGRILSDVAVNSLHIPLNFQKLLREEDSQGFSDICTHIA